MASDTQEKIGIVGAGRMGSGVAQSCAEAGMSVYLVDVKRKSIALAMSAMASDLDARIEEGKLSVADKAAILGRIQTSTSFDILKGCPLCLEAVLENQGIKCYIHKKIRKTCGPKTLIATNTINLSVADMAKADTAPENFMGLVFGFPPQTAKDAKIIPGPATSNASIETAKRLVVASGKKPFMAEDKKIPFQISAKNIALFLSALSIFGIAGLWGLPHFKIPENIEHPLSIGLFALSFISSILLFFITTGSLKRLRRMIVALTALAADDLTVEIPDRERKDDYGELARIIQVFKLITQNLDHMEAEEEEKKAQLAIDKKKMMEEMASDFKDHIGKIVETVSASATKLQYNAKNLSEMAEDTTRQTTSIASATEEASSSVQTVASASEELSASISEINRQIEESSRVAASAVDQVKKTDITVSSLADAAAQIGDVVKLIQAIAEQTNLLALNATIEAARAGEAGKGFAVVASEVKNLANQTAKATEEIGAKIITVQTVSNESVEAIRSIGTIIERIDEITNTIADSLRQQESATHEISKNVQQASAGTNEVAGSIASVTQVMGESRNGAHEVLDSSTELSQQASDLRLGIQDFLKKILAS